MLNAISNAIQYIIDMGASVMLPIVIALISIAIGVKVGKSIRSGLMIGVGFVGLSLIVDMMNAQLGPAAAAMSERFGLSLSVVDIGWPGALPMTWSSNIATVAIPVAIGVNVLMIALKLTKTVNIDIWNIWHMTFTGAIAYAVLVPGNQVLPFGDLATIGFFIAIAVAVHNGNLFRTLFSGSLIMFMTVWIANQTIPWMTALARTTGSTDGSSLIAALDQGGCPLTYIYTQICTRENLVGLAVIAVIYGICILFAVRYSKTRGAALGADGE